MADEKVNVNQEVNKVKVNSITPKVTAAETGGDVIRTRDTVKIVKVTENKSEIIKIVTPGPRSYNIQQVFRTRRSITEFRSDKR